MGARCSSPPQPADTVLAVAPPRPQRRKGFLLTSPGFEADDPHLREIRQAMSLLLPRARAPEMVERCVGEGRPLLLEDAEFEQLRRSVGRVERVKCGSQDFEASFCVCEGHWSNPGNERGLLDNSVLPNWIQIVGNFSAVPPGDYLVYWHVKYEQPESELVEGGKWAVSARVGDPDSGSGEALCSDCADSLTFRGSSSRRLRLTYLDESVVRPGDLQQWRRLALGVVEVRGGESQVLTSFGWNPRWPRSFSLCHAGILRLATPWETKRLLLLGMARQQLASCPLQMLDADTARLVLSYLR